MKHIAKRILSFICVFCLLLADWGGILPQILTTGADAAYSATREVSASDGKTYAVTVSCDDDSIPDDAVLRVTELTDDDRSDYVAESAALLGTQPEGLAFARAFDISLRDPETGAEFQPGGSVHVSIALLDTELDAEEQINVVHFGDAPEVLDSTVNGDAVEFEAESFSVYVVAGNVVRYLKYVFYQSNGEVYPIKDGSNADVNEQLIKRGEKPLIPQPTSSDGKPFAGWFEKIDTTSTGVPVLADDPFDFDNPDYEVGFTSNTKQVDLYPQYTTYGYIIFHDQYDDTAGTFPRTCVPSGAETTIWSPSAACATLIGTLISTSAPSRENTGCG